jgi:ribosome-associated protein
MVVATGTSARHVGALGDAVMRALKAAGVRNVRAQGLARGDWGLVDGGDVVVHIMRPEVRAFYAIEDLWSE